MSHYFDYEAWVKEANDAAGNDTTQIEVKKPSKKQMKKYREAKSQKKAAKQSWLFD